MTTQNEDFSPCSARQSLVQYKRDGSKERVQRCTEQTAEKMGLNVIPSDCEACPVRREITKKAWDRGSYKPPLVAEVSAVKGEKRDTEAPKEWPPCFDRKVVTIGGCCGYEKDVRVCDSADCFRLGSQVNPLMCGECPHRRDPSKDSQS